MLPKKGEIIKFNFHGFGLISQEETEVIDVNQKIITISTGDPEYQFDAKTGKCLNENNYMGCKRTLSKEYLINNK